MKNVLRSIAPALLFAFLFNSFAHATEAQSSTDAPSDIAQSTSADQSSSVPPPPGSTVPVQQIVSAHTVFLSNAWSDPNFPIDPADAYNEVHAALQDWGRYQLVNSPEQADLIFQLRGIAPITEVDAAAHGALYSVTSPAFLLTLVDPKTNGALWTITSPIYLNGRGRTREQWQELSITNLISRIKTLRNEPLSETETADLVTFPKYHHLRTALIVGGIAAGAIVASVIATHHSINNQKASQDRFCQMNNIPLSECAGG